MGNPADAHRKALKNKEKAKNKKARVEARKVATVKSDTRGLETDIRELSEKEKNGTLSTEDAQLLADSRKQLERVQKTKADFVEAHPEKKHLVFRGSRRTGDGAPKQEQVQRFGKDGKLIDPKRSLYYDPVLNPFGNPPPGMPYAERPMSDDEDDSDDDDIVMPEGPPPPEARAEDSDEEFELPPGPPPHAVPSALQAGPSRLPYMPAASSTYSAPPIVSAPPAIWQQAAPPLPHFAQPMHQPPPPVFYPPQPAMQAPPSLPPAPVTSTSAVPPTAPWIASPATPAAPSPFLSVGQAAVVAAPQLRDLKREATAFVPQAIKRRKVVPAAAPAAAPIAAAPVVESSEEPPAGPKRPAAPSLLGAVASAMGQR